jgi:hypothetical protein
MATFRIAKQQQLTTKQQKSWEKQQLTTILPKPSCVPKLPSKELSRKQRMRKASDGTQGNPIFCPHQHCNVP